MWTNWIGLLRTASGIRRPGRTYARQPAIEFTLGVDPDSVRWEDFHPELAAADSPAPGKQ